MADKPQYGRKKRVSHNVGHDFRKSTGEHLDTLVSDDWQTTDDGHVFRLLRRTIQRWHGFSHRTTGFILTLPYASPVTIALKPQNKFDDWAIGQRISSEHRFNDDVFDKEVFIDCDDAVTIHQVLGAQDQRDAARDVLRTSESAIDFDQHGVSIELDYDFISVGTRELPSEKAEETLRRIVQAMQPLVRSLGSAPKAAPGSNVLGRIASLSSLTFVPVLVMVFLPDPLRRGSAMPDESILWTAWVGALVLASLFGVGWLKIAPTSAAVHRRAFWGAVGAFVFLAGCAPLFANMNRWLASDPGQLYHAPVRDKRMTSSRRGFNSYAIQVADWRGGDGRFWLDVDDEVYGKIPRGGQACARFRVHDGAFGFSYHSNVVIATGTPRAACRNTE